MNQVQKPQFRQLCTHFDLKQDTNNMYRYKQWDWFNNQKPLFVIAKSINSYTEGIVNGML